MIGRSEDSDSFITKCPQQEQKEKNNNSSNYYVCLAIVHMMQV